MKAAIYARVSTDSQATRHDRLATGRAAGARRGGGRRVGRGVLRRRALRRPAGPARAGQPAGRREAGLIERVWCLSPDRLARVYAYQVIVLDELARHRVQVAFADAPAIDDDPQAKLLTQVQGVIAEYERAKIAERYRRGKLFRSRAGEVITWRVPYGYRRLPRGSAGPARLEIYEPEAEVVRRIFHDTVAGGCSTREIARQLAADQICTPSGRQAIWHTSTISRLLRNEAYIGRVYFNRTETVPIPARRRATDRSCDRWPPAGVVLAEPSVLLRLRLDVGSTSSSDEPLIPGADRPW